jgi:hypothetical protein
MPQGSSHTARSAAFDRRERLAKIGIALVIAAVALTYVMTWQRRAPLENRQSIATLCAAQYRRATSAIDSAVVDRAKPFIDETDLAKPVACGELRRAGKIH